MDNQNNILYKKIKEKLIKDYSNLNYYDTFPSERELCEKYKVSRPTIKSALKLLEEENLIIKKPRKGTFFLGNSPYTDHQISSVIGFYNDVKLQGRKTKSKVLFQNTERADEYIAKKLKIKSGDYIFRLERLRYLDGNIFALTNSYLPLKFVDYLISKDFSDCSLYDVLSKKGITPFSGNQELIIAPANKYEAMHLNIKENSPISILKSTTYTKDKELIEYVEAKSNAYRTKYEMKVFHKNNIY
ncbi:GntR family transcriptional regulator [Anaerofustis sp.]|uniref:GntR family transcriptional regulator n=1 Tax=Anaerofustis sp. TaxID=1872517 RepID=UPI0025B949DD|nr:GntR family transcriptional regulator [Anaerofustis sp.]